MLFDSGCFGFALASAGGCCGLCCGLFRVSGGVSGLDYLSAGLICLCFLLFAYCGLIFFWVGCDCVCGLRLVWF